MCEYLTQVVFLVILFSSCSSYTPIVLWHGMTDTCSNKSEMGRLQRDLRAYLPGVYVLCLQLGNSMLEDYLISFYTHPDKQIEMACDIIKSDVNLVNGYNGVGYSQGGQLMRGLLQRCPEPRMKNFITLAGQHQGVYGNPYCNIFRLFCDFVRLAADKIAYSRIVQKFLSMMTYWHTPLNRSAYVEGSTFLAEINNEKSINPFYIRNLQALEKFIMIKCKADNVIFPAETEWFGFYKPGTLNEIETLQESELYINGRLGLKQMDQDGKLYFILAPWGHQHFEWPWFRDNIVDSFLI